ncbi:hypothetical protein [Jannaschia sp. LMIT008]|uniref:hypothetical protein n=1 Tax=Jannaschia maritima TaxID=3032585 RepID=UPI002811D369|nr:hypothetical protein [Jannaschia sp. LMIT008]
MEWREVAPWMEFRIFFRDGAPVGISQADPYRRHPEIADRAADLSGALNRFTRHIAGALPIPTCAADVAIGHGDPAEPWLIELNPFDARLDAALFDGAGTGAFDGSFRYVR